MRPATFGFFFFACSFSMASSCDFWSKFSNSFFVRLVAGSSSTSGFEAHDVSVTPAALRLGPGESATYTVQVAGGTRTSDDGVVLWRGGNGTRTRVPVQLTR